MSASATRIAASRLTVVASATRRSHLGAASSRNVLLGTATCHDTDEIISMTFASASVESDRTVQARTICPREAMATAEASSVRNFASCRRGIGSAWSTNPGGLAIDLFFRIARDPATGVRPVAARGETLAIGLAPLAVDEEERRRLRSASDAVARPLTIAEHLSPRAEPARFTSVVAGAP